MTRALLIVLLCLLATVPQRVCVCDHAHHTVDAPEHDTHEQTPDHDTPSDHDCPCRYHPTNRVPHLPPRVLDQVETFDVIGIADPLTGARIVATSAHTSTPQGVRPYAALPVYLSTARLRT